ncbi:hypothetical protein PILCRDRAFT_821435 [Piloderma croceum F 1598]|uniref:Uncharacterized protein n=1 Tax=Piloderma croceum (strain F 1598) TaxID=765440 RepID=A0A0C3BVE7_PILCF|nr:hypothetical protein PILCRDRAFT_821435 [Piloderma croceum F 1598]
MIWQFGHGKARCIRGGMFGILTRPAVLNRLSKIDLSGARGVVSVLAPWIAEQDRQEDACARRDRKLSTFII